MTDVLLQAQAVTKRFGGLVAVNEVSFDILRGEIRGLIGPNGAGKSSLFNLLAGALAPTSGSIRLNGREIGGAPAHEVARAGLSRGFQLVHLFPTLTVGENVLVGAERGLDMGWWQNITHLGGFRRTRAAAVLRAEEALAGAGIAHLSRTPVQELSYGQQRLVAAARAMAAEPQLLLLDEPGAGLSESELAQLRTSMLHARGRGMTILVVEHNVPFVMGIADRILVLNNGAQIADGAPSEVRENRNVMEAYLGH